MDLAPGKSSSMTLSDHNRHFWDQHAHEVYGQEWVQQLGTVITRALRDHAGPMKLNKGHDGTSPTRMLDYACGEGAASRALMPFVDSIRGVDISEKMVGLYNEMANNNSTNADKMMAVRGNFLSQGEEACAHLDGFDIAVMSMALHHMEQPARIISELVKRVKAGGVVAVLDWVPTTEDKTSGKQVHVHGEPGDRKVPAFGAETISQEVLSPEVVLAMFAESGCDMTTAYYVIVGEKSHLPENIANVAGGLWKNLFIAYAAKA